MQNSESSYKKFFQLSVSTGNIRTSDYERVCETEIGYKRVYETDYKRVYETEIGYSILLAFIDFQPTVMVGYSSQTALIPLTQVEKAPEHTGN